MAKKTPRPVRTLVIFGLAIVVLYGLAALGQTWKPRLGLDLEGGTRITLSAIDRGRAPSPPTKLKQAAGIVDARVNGSGVSEAEVSTQGNRNIIVEIPGENRSDLVNSVKRTAQLRFRLVAGQPQPGTPEAQPKASDQSSPSASPSGKAGSKQKAKRPEAGKATPELTPRPVRRAPPDPDSGPAAQAAPPGAQPVPASSSPRSPRRVPRSTSPLAWSQDPGVEWLQKFATFTCPAKGETRPRSPTTPTSR